MCRSGNEGSNVGARRCNGGLSHEQFLARRRAEYAANKSGAKDKRKARYQEPLPEVAAFSQSSESCSVIMERDWEDSLLRTKGVSAPVADLQLMKDVAINQANDLSVMDILEEDIYFNQANETLNSVRLLELDPGDGDESVWGYWKSYQEATHDEDDSFDFYDTNPALMTVNEVASYELSQALGEGFNQFVPRTVIREYNGQIGSLQEEAEGDNLMGYMMKVKKPGERLTTSQALGEEQLRKLAIFDYISGSQDRHDDNLLITEDGKVSLIDNGFSFPVVKDFHVNLSVFTNYFRRPQADGSDQLTESEKDTLQNFYDSPDMHGMKNMLHPGAYEGMRARTKELLDLGKIQDVRISTGRGF